MNKDNNIKLIIFDFDGVIINEYKKHYELNKEQITDLTEKEFKRLFEGNIHIERAKLKHRDTGFDAVYHFNEYRKKAIIPKEIKESLERLRERYALGIITSAREDSTNECIKYNNLDNVFAFVYGQETHKLKSEKFNKVSRLGILPNKCIFVTDTLGDILEANELAIKTVAVDYGYHNTETLKKGNPYKIVSNFSEIEKIAKEITHLGE